MDPASMIALGTVFATQFIQVQVLLVLQVIFTITGFLSPSIG